MVKIVRDGIAKFLGSSEVTYERASDEQLVEGLRKKLIEEAAEYVVNPSLGELADVIEVVKALAHYDLGLGPTAFVKVLGEAGAKREERGGFDEGMAMFVCSTAPARHEGEHAEVAR